MGTAPEVPDDYFQKRFPFIKRLQLICATAENEDRDLFKNPNDRTTVTDYDFDRLIRACENILRKGLKPQIKTGYVPLKLSDSPAISGEFKTNLRPPKDYDVYYAYIKAAVDALKARFGLQEMKTWTWGVGQEYDVGLWFMTADRRRSLSTVPSLWDNGWPRGIAQRCFSLPATDFGNAA